MSNHNSTPPRGELFEDNTAKAVWAAICTLDEASQHELLVALRQRLAIAEERDTPQQVRIARAVAALREAAELLEQETGETELSADTYRRLRDEHADRRWPPDPSLRRWLGGTWNDALRRARLEPVRDGDTLVCRLGSPITREEAILAIRQFVEEFGHIPTLSQYCHWAKRPDVRRRVGRRPLSQGPFDRLFGGWLPALQAAGVVAGDAPARPPGSNNGQVRPSGYGFTTEQIREALREVAALVGRAPRTSEYTRVRAELLDRQDATGKPLRAMPSYHVINDRYATWDDALVDAGLEPLGGRGTTSNPPKELKRSKRVTDEQILAALHEAYTDVGEPFTTSAYAQWRSRQQEEDRQVGRYRNLPHWDTARERFGSWAHVLEAVRRLGETSE